jgi:hypothetical protein
MSISRSMAIDGARRGAAALRGNLDERAAGLSAARVRDRPR